MPFSLSELSEHNCLVGSSPLWVFSEQGKERNSSITGNIHCNSGFALLDAAIKGIGLIQLPDYYVQEALNKRQLTECLTSYRAPLQAISAVHPNNRYLTLKVKLLLDFLRSKLTQE